MSNAIGASAARSTHAGGVSDATGYYVAMPAVGAMIGAMAAAWSIQAQGLPTVPRAGVPVVAAAAVHAVHVAAAAPAAPPVPAAMKPRDLGKHAASAPAPVAVKPGDVRKQAASAPAPAAVKPRDVRKQAASAPAPVAAKPGDVRKQTASAPARPLKSKALTAPQPRPERQKPEAVAQSHAPRRTQASAPASKTEPASAPKHAAAPPSARRKGVLRINSRPWSAVYVDGRLVGTTPQTALAVEPGRHRIELVNQEFDLRRKLSVDVRSGRTVTRVVELMQ